MTVLVLVRHAEAEVRVRGGPSEDERSLTATGERQAVELVAELIRYGATAMVSSPYRRAFDTVAPTAAALGLEVARRPDLREWDDGLETVDDWLPFYEQCWQDPDHRHGSGETHHELSIRAGRAIGALLAESGDRVVIAASHGTWIARGLEGVGAPVSPTFWRAMPNPAVYVLTQNGPTIVASGPGLPGVG